MGTPDLDLVKELNAMGSEQPVRPPAPEYEDITIRELSIGFSGGVQDLTLYPEDTMETDDAGNIRVTLTTLGGGEFVAYAGHTQWHSLHEHPHRRVKGTLRPDPAKIAKDFYERKKQEEADMRKDMSRRLASEVDEN